MEQRPSALVAFGSIGIAAATWVVVGAPILNVERHAEIEKWL